MAKKSIAAKKTAKKKAPKKGAKKATSKVAVKVKREIVPITPELHQKRKALARLHSNGMMRGKALHQFDLKNKLK